MDRSTSYNLRNAKIGDKVAIYRRGNFVRLDTVTRVTMGASYRGSSTLVAKSVWLSDKSRWTGGGREYGSSDWSSNHASIVLDDELWLKERAEARARVAMQKMREQVAAINHSSLTNDEIVAIKTIINGAAVRAGAIAAADYVIKLTR